MGIEDRDWYKDAQRKRLNQDYRYDPKQFRAPRNTHHTPGKAGVIWRTIVYCLAVYGAMTLLQQVHTKMGKPTQYKPPVVIPSR